MMTMSDENDGMQPIQQDRLILRLTPAESLKVAGCIFDGHRGQYIYDGIIDLANDYGYHDEIAIRDPEGNLTDDAVEITDDAVDWLNDHVATEGWSFGWNDGEFFYQENEWWSEEAQ